MTNLVMKKIRETRKRIPISSNFYFCYYIHSYTCIHLILFCRSEWALRNWLRKRGKSKYIDFEDDKRKLLWEYFKSLDDDGSESIGADELEDPLIALGLVNNRGDVDKIIEIVDDDKTGAIEFQEFLKIITLGKRNDANKQENYTKISEKDDWIRKIYRFFKDLTEGKYKEDDKEIPFGLFISKYRRRQLLNAMMTDDK